MDISKMQFRAMLPHATARNIEVFYEPFVATCKKFDINTKQRLAAFVAQVAHESGSLRYMEEIASGEVYDTGRLAAMLENTPEKDGDGQKYKGRGLIQLTGRGNYKRFGKAVGQDFIKDPEKIEAPYWACMAAGWFWQYRKLNQFADSGDFETLTKKINGGLNGFSDRKERWAEAKKALSI